MPGITNSCVEKIRSGGIQAMGTTDQCFKMEPQRNWQGLWRNDFEGSRFCPAPARQCMFETPGDRIRLDTRDPQFPQPEGMRGALYAIEFIGRKTAYPFLEDPFGYEMIVDRLISLKKIEPPPPASEDLPPGWMRCTAKGECSSSDEMQAKSKGTK